MKAGDFFRNGGRYLDRMDTFFDKALNRNGKVNRFSTEDVGTVEVAGFTVTCKSAGKHTTRPFQDFSKIKGNASKEFSAKMLFDEVCRQGFRGRNNIEFTCKIADTGVETKLDLSDFIKTDEFGGQQKGGTKVNMGNVYENDLTEALIDHCSGRKPKKYQDHVKKIVDAMVKKYGAAPTKAIGEGSKNQARPLKKKGNNIVISAGGSTATYDIGKTLTDITLTVAGKPVYLSVKFGSTLSFFNCGIKGTGKNKLNLFPEASLVAGEVPDDGQEYLEMFGIDQQKFIDVFAKYGKVTGTTVDNHIEQTTLSPSGKKALQEMIKSGVGYGYWMVHYTGTKVECYEIDKEYMNKAASLVGNTVEINYGGAGGRGKRVDMIFETKSYDFKFNIRNKQGGIYPTHSNGDYYKK